MMLSRVLCAIPAFVSYSRASENQPNVPYHWQNGHSQSTLMPPSMQQSQQMVGPQGDLLLNAAYDASHESRQQNYAFSQEISQELSNQQMMPGLNELDNSALSDGMSEPQVNQQPILEPPMLPPNEQRFEVRFIDSNNQLPLSSWIPIVYITHAMFDPRNTDHIVGYFSQSSDGILKWHEYELDQNPMIKEQTVDIDASLGYGFVDCLPGVRIQVIDRQIAHPIQTVVDHPVQHSVSSDQTDEQRVSQEPAKKKERRFIVRMEQSPKKDQWVEKALFEVGEQQRFLMHPDKSDVIGWFSKGIDGSELKWTEKPEDNFQPEISETIVWDRQQREQTIQTRFEDVRFKVEILEEKHSENKPKKMKQVRNHPPMSYSSNNRRSKFIPLRRSMKRLSSFADDTSEVPSPIYFRESQNEESTSVMYDGHFSEDQITMEPMVEPFPLSSDEQKYRVSIGNGRNIPFSSWKKIDSIPYLISDPLDGRLLGHLSENSDGTVKWHQYNWDRTQVILEKDVQISSLLGFGEIDLDCELHIRVAPLKMTEQEQQTSQIKPPKKKFKVRMDHFEKENWVEKDRFELDENQPSRSIHHPNNRDGIVGKFVQKGGDLDWIGRDVEFFGADIFPNIFRNSGKKETTVNLRYHNDIRFRVKRKGERIVFQTKNTPMMEFRNDCEHAVKTLLLRPHVMGDPQKNRVMVVLGQVALLGGFKNLDMRENPDILLRRMDLSTAMDLDELLSHIGGKIDSLKWREWFGYETHSGIDLKAFMLKSLENPKSEDSSKYRKILDYMSKHGMRFSDDLLAANPQQFRLLLGKSTYQISKDGKSVPPHSVDRLIGAPGSCQRAAFFGDDNPAYAAKGELVGWHCQ